MGYFFFNDKKGGSLSRHSCHSRHTDLFTPRAPRGELVLVAGHAVVLVLVGNEGLGANRLLAAVTDEAALVPCRARVLQFPRAWWGRNREVRQGEEGRGHLAGEGVAPALSF